MNNLAERIQTKFRCKLHNLPIQYICFDVYCNHRARYLCSLCIHRDPQADLKDIGNIALFLIDCKTKYDAQVLYAKQEIREAWKQIQQEVKNGLVELEFEKQLEQRIDSVSGEYELEQLFRLCSAKVFTPGNFNQIGTLLSRNIKITTTLGYELINQTPIHVQPSYISAMELVQKCRKEVEQFQSINNTTLLRLAEKELHKKLNLTHPKKHDLDFQRIENKSQEYKLAMRIVVKKNMVDTVKFNHDESELAVTGRGFILMIRMDNGKLTNQSQFLHTHVSEIRNLRFNHNSTLFIADNELQYEAIIWQKLNGQWKYKTKLQCNNGYFDFAFNRNSFILAATEDEDSKLRIFSVSSNRYKLVKSLKLQNIQARVAFQLDQTLMVTNDAFIMFYNFKNNQISNEPLKDGFNLIDSDLESTFSFNPQSNMLAYDNNGILMIWKQNLRHKGLWHYSRIFVSSFEIRSISFNEDSSILVTTSIQWLMVWKYEKDTQKWCYYYGICNDKKLCYAVISRDSSIIIGLQVDGTISLYNLQKLHK